MSFFGGGGGYNQFGGRGGGFRPPQQHNQNNMRFGILPLMRPNQQMHPRFGGNQRGGGRFQFRRGNNYNPNRFRVPARGDIIRMGPDKPVVNQNKNSEDFTKDVTDDAELKPIPSPVVKTNETENKPKDVKSEVKPQTDIKKETEIKNEIKEETPSTSIVELDRYNSELHVALSDNNKVGEVIKGEGFQYMWGGVRATCGITKGMVCYEVHILENDKVDLPDEKSPCVCRVGWSVDGSSYQLGEDKLSWGYGGTGKSSIESKFRDYGKLFGVGDVITCYVDLDKVPKAIFFALNGEYLGVAFRFTNELGSKALFPHVTSKNVKYKVNFGQEPPKFPLTSGFSMIGALPEAQLIRPSPGPKNATEAEVIVMVGLPGSGKSHWCENYVREHAEKKYYILGTNLIIDRMKITGLSRKRNYHGRWEELIKRASGILNKLFVVAKSNPRNYILDQTNVYFTARRRKMESFKQYKRKAVVIVNKPQILAQRIEKQQQLEGKIIPANAIMEMKKNFTLPECGPSFDEVTYVEEKLPGARDIVQLYRKEGEDYKSSTPNTPAPGEKRNSPKRHQQNGSSLEKRPKLEPSSSSDRTPNRRPSSERTPIRGVSPSNVGPGRGAPPPLSDSRSHRSSDESRRSIRDDDRHHHRSDKREERVGRSPSGHDISARGGGDRFSKDGQRSNSRDTRDRDATKDRDGGRPPRRSDDRGDRSTNRSTNRRDEPPPPRFDDHRRSSSGRPESRRDTSKDRYDRSASVRSDRDRNEKPPPLKESYGDQPPLDRRGREMSPLPPTARSQDIRIGGEPVSRGAPPYDHRNPAAKLLPRDGFDARSSTDRPRDPFHGVYPPPRGDLPPPKNDIPPPAKNQMLPPGDQYKRGYPPAAEGRPLLDRRPGDYPTPPRGDHLARNIPPSQDALYDRRDDKYLDEPLMRYDRATPRDDYRLDRPLSQQLQQQQRPEDDIYRRGYDAPYNEEREDGYCDARPVLPPRSHHDLLPPVKDEFPAHRREEFPVKREDFSARQNDLPIRRDEFPPRRDEFPPRRDEFPPRRDEFSPRRDEPQQLRRNDFPPPRREDFPPRREELPTAARRGVDPPPFARKDEILPRGGGVEISRREEFPIRPREEFPIRPREEFPAHRDGPPLSRRDEYERENLALRPPYDNRFDDRQLQPPGPERRAPYYEREEDYQRRLSDVPRPRDAYSDDRRSDFHDLRVDKEEVHYNRGVEEPLYERHDREYLPSRGDYRGEERDRFNHPPHSRYPPQQQEDRDRPYRKDDPYSAGPDRSMELDNAPQHDRDYQENPTNGDTTDDYNRVNRERGSYQTQMTTSTANYGHTTTPSQSFYQSNEPLNVVPSRREQRDRGNSQSNQHHQGDPSSRHRIGNEGVGDDRGGHPPPPANPSDRSSQSYEKQQEDYQKAYSQWYANYAQAFAALSQQDKK